MQDTTGTTRDILKAIVALRKQCLDSFDKRRSYEWKISLALWAGIGIMTGFLYPHRAPFAGAVHWSIAALVFASVVGVYGFGWAPQVARRQLDDLARAEVYRKAAESLLAHGGNPSFDVSSAGYWQGFLDFASWTKTAITGAFFLMAWLALYS